jgi:hypothetical protein
MSILSGLVIVSRFWVDDHCIQSAMKSQEGVSDERLLFYLWLIKEKAVSLLRRLFAIYSVVTVYFPNLIEA